ncbi:8-oxoguanine DNA glycosylase OGG fold protein [Nonlabens agnitus]|uniref:Uncharacterized protein n=1 Tax=Nonlabens agnitus TaxID=870484 RepID=A0A2S9WS36_9FLAO|nr:hypothetical protein [Nonlabens agnitus]PRP66285.1 hypothetical protein BST86_03850 [Nonlabens agnitus]
MRIKSFQEFICSFPYEYQASNISRKNWIRFFPINPLVKEVFNNNEVIAITRKELYDTNKNIELFIVKVLIWGFATGGRGNNVLKLLSEPNFSILVDKLKSYRNADLEMQKIESDMNQISGLAISSITKFTHFMNTTVNGHKAIILDQQIMNTIQLNRFKDLEPLMGVKPTNAVRRYPDYIKIIDQLSIDLNATPDQIEMFIFLFGRTMVIK